MTLADAVVIGMACCSCCKPLLQMVGMFRAKHTS